MPMSHSFEHHILTTMSEKVEKSFSHLVITKTERDEQKEIRSQIYIFVHTWEFEKK